MPVRDGMQLYKRIFIMESEGKWRVTSMLWILHDPIFIGEGSLDVKHQGALGGAFVLLPLSRHERLESCCDKITSTIW